MPRLGALKLLRLQMKIIYIVIFIFLGIACSSKVDDYLSQAERYIDTNPEAALCCLDSVKQFGELNLSKLTYYTFLRWHAMYRKEGMIEDFIPSDQFVEYWLGKEDLYKAGYLCLYNGIYYLYESRLDNAAIYLSRAQTLALKQQDSALIFYSYYYQGKLYYENNEFYNGEIAFRKALEYRQEKKKKDDFHYIFKLANCYLFVKEYDKARYHYQCILQHIGEYGEDKMALRLMNVAAFSEEDKEVTGYLKDYLRESFENNEYVQLYDGLAHAESALSRGQLDSVAMYISSLPSDTRFWQPSIRLLHYRLMGQYYFQLGDYKRAGEILKRYIQSQDSLRMSAHNEQINHMIISYVRAKLENEANLLKAQKNKWAAGILVAVIVCLVAFFSFYLWRKRRDERIWEVERRVETLQKLCELQEGQTNKIKCILMNKLELSRRLASLSCQELPKNVSFLKMYDEMLGGVHSTVLNWEEFYLVIDTLYADFHNKLLQYFPVLSEKEIQTLCLLKGGFRNDEIAFVMDTGIASVYKRRTTIREKLNLEERMDILAGAEGLLAQIDCK